MIFHGSFRLQKRSNHARMSDHKGKFWVILTEEEKHCRLILLVGCARSTNGDALWWWLQGSEVISAYPCPVVVASKRGLKEYGYQRKIRGYKCLHSLLFCFFPGRRRFIPQRTRMPCRQGVCSSECLPVSNLAIKISHGGKLIQGLAGVARGTVRCD